LRAITTSVSPGQSPQYGPLHGATLDDLVAAVRLVRGQKADFTMVWERLLPAPARPDSE
jgi:hypothetical protein